MPYVAFPSSVVLSWNRSRTLWKMLSQGHKWYFNTTSISFLAFSLDVAFAFFSFVRRRVCFGGANWTRLSQRPREALFPFGPLFIRLQRVHLSNVTAGTQGDPAANVAVDSSLPGIEELSFRSFYWIVSLPIQIPAVQPPHLK